MSGEQAGRPRATRQAIRRATAAAAGVVVGEDLGEEGGQGDRGGEDPVAGRARLLGDDAGDVPGVDAAGMRPMAIRAIPSCRAAAAWHAFHRWLNSGETAIPIMVRRAMTATAIIIRRTVNRTRGTRMAVVLKGSRCPGRS